MATQLHVAYSSVFMGAGILAGIPYYCVQNHPLLQLECATNPGKVDIGELLKETGKFADAGKIDPTGNMRNDRVFILNGYLDTTVNPEFGDLVKKYYESYMPSSSIMLYKFNAEHTFPTMNYGNLCTQSRSPYLSKCNYDGAFETLDFIYGGTLRRPTGSVSLAGDFYLYDQKEFIYQGRPSSISLDDTGFVYVPSGCVFNQNRCKLHVALHGCTQGKHAVNDVFARNAGYNEVGELNNIIILYPQATNSLVNPVNALGCWDWWGYTNSDYAVKAGPQMQAIWRMVDRVS